MGGISFMRDGGRGSQEEKSGFDANHAWSGKTYPQGVSGVSRFRRDHRFFHRYPPNDILPCCPSACRMRGQSAHRPLRKHHELVAKPTVSYRPSLLWFLDHETLDDKKMPT